MKQILIIISLCCCINMSAQDRTPLDKVYEDISTIISVPYSGYKQKINHGDGVVMYVHNDMLGKEFLCSKECGTSDYFGDMTTEEVKQANDRNGKMFDSMFRIVCSNLDSLIQVSEESYHHESHVKGNDTIIYSICMKNGEDTVKAIKALDGSMIFPNALEIVSFNFTAAPKSCGKHVRGMGTLSYNKNVYLPNRKSTYFEKEPYLKKIIPILKQKGIKFWNFTWAQSADFDIQANMGKEFAWGESMSFTNEGHTTGTMYFIPREKKVLAEDIFASIDSITLAHTDIHPEQMFRYVYNVPERVMQYENVITELFSGTTQLYDDRAAEAHVYVKLLLGISPEGYYVAVVDATNSFYMPKEWYKLKSFVDGKKKYIK